MRFTKIFFKCENLPYASRKDKESTGKNFLNRCRVCLFKKALMLLQYTVSVSKFKVTLGGKSSCLALIGSKLETKTRTFQLHLLCHFGANSTKFHFLSRLRRLLHTEIQVSLFYISGKEDYKKKVFLK